MTSTKLQTHEKAKKIIGLIAARDLTGIHRRLHPIIAVQHCVLPAVRVCTLIQLKRK